MRAVGNVGAPVTIRCHGATRHGEERSTSETKGLLMLEELAAAGVDFERFRRCNRTITASGSPSGTGVAWFKDTGGNVLSVSQT